MAFKRIAIIMTLAIVCFFVTIVVIVIIAVIAIIIVIAVMVIMAIVILIIAYEMLLYKRYHAHYLMQRTVLDRLPLVNILLLYGAHGF